MFSLRWWRLHYLRHRGDASGRHLAELLDRPRRLLIAILVGNTIVNVAASSIAERVVGENLPEQGVWIAIMAMTILLLLLGEVTPKTLAVQNPERVALLVARPLKLLCFIMSPLLYVFSKISAFTTRLGIRNQSHPKLHGITDFMNLVAESVQAGIITAAERDVVSSIVAMADVPVSRVMVPRTQIIALPEDASYDEAVNTFLHHEIWRIPIYRESLDCIVGVLYAKDLITGQINPSQQKSPGLLAREPYFVPDCISVKQLYAAFRQQQILFAVILDEYGGTAGIVTHDDILHVLFHPVGEEKNDLDHAVECHPDGSFTVEASISLDELARLTGLRLESEAFRTLNGYLLDHFGMVPREGDSMQLRTDESGTLQQWVAIVQKTSFTQIECVRIQPVPITENPSE